MGKGTPSTMFYLDEDATLAYMAQERWELAAYVYLCDVYIPETPYTKEHMSVMGPALCEYINSGTALGVQIRSVFADGWDT